MTFAQYLRIETSLGGIGCTDKQFIKACLDFILPQAKHHHLYRESRHAFIRDGLAYLDNSRKLAFGMKLQKNYTKPPTTDDLNHAWYYHKTGWWDAY